MRIHWHAIHWRRILSVGLMLVVFGIFLPILVFSYFDGGVFQPANEVNVNNLSENERIQLSVRSELRNLEQKRLNIRYEIDRLQQEWDVLNDRISRQQRDLNNVALSLGEAIRTREELSQTQTTILRIPLTIANNSLGGGKSSLLKTLTGCSLEECFDYSKCPLSCYFKVYFYPLELSRLVGVPDSIIGQLSDAIKSNVQTTSDPHAACLFIHISSSQSDYETFSNLKYWNGDGSNHLIVILDNCTDQHCRYINTKETGRALVARQTFSPAAFRHNFDIVLPTFNTESSPAAAILPARKKILLSYQGTYVEPSQNHITTEKTLSDKYIETLLAHLSEKNDLIEIRTKCGHVNDVSSLEGYAGQWIDCLSDEALQDTTFGLILAPNRQTYLSTDILMRRLRKIIHAGAVPVILGDARLPFDQHLEWEKVAIFLPKARTTELYFVLKTYSDADIVALKRQGRIFYETYLSSPRLVLETLLSVVRHMIKMPSPYEQEESGDLVANLGFGPVNQQFSSETDEMLGPLETPYSSPSFFRNYSISLNFWRDTFNKDYAPHRSVPARPDDPILPSDARFRGSSSGFRPIGFGSGGSGKEFSEAIGGNSPREQFTAVVLTYERQQVLLEGISSLKGLPYLNKVLVVWNGPESPGPETLTWPDIGVPVQVLKAKKNSLNNRFIPWDAIETDAVLSLDDDARLRHDELIFAFRVWRENRDRIVGFPGRFHAYDSVNKQWNYNSNHSCELSMVLTGAAFVHKYYLHAYTHQMYPEIREIVDKLMNCEDIALNYLVSHLTRRPPIKVTSKWTFRCPGCPVALSEHDSHFSERHDCINRFTQLYGYNPLLYTQFRADSVLFKTRVPHDKQKCFKYV